MFAKSDVDAGAFLCQYNGELISGNEGEQREHSIPSCFRFFFRHGEKKLWYVVFSIILTCLNTVYGIIFLLIRLYVSVTYLDQPKTFKHTAT